MAAPAPDLFLPPILAEDDDAFRSRVWTHYRVAARPMPWRSDFSPYRVLVSEFMLQQTQVSRVIPRFEEFIGTFPTIASLAAAPLAAVLTAWTGLGYNRRARFLHESARIIVSTRDGHVPGDEAELVQLPGIGVNTAGSIAAFAYNRPSVFIETNIRRAVLTHYLHDTEPVSDRDVREVVARTLDREKPRRWYWALMDYGEMLGRTQPNANRRSRHYSRQSPFENSDRQLRGRILKTLTAAESLAAEELPRYTGFSVERVTRQLERLAREGLVEHSEPDRWRLPH